MMDPTALQIAWFLLFGVLVAGYAVLDGFDLGVGALTLTRRAADERRRMMRAIGPVWDGNEVWLLTAGGALFAAFPAVYATVFSGFYLALMLLLVALIARAVALEFRGAVDSPAWRLLWDRAFGIGSLVPALLFGVAVGNIMRGIPLDAAGEYAGTFLGLLHPYPLLVGLLALAMFACHGAIYMAHKSDGPLAEAMARYATKAWAAWVALYIATTVATVFFAPHLFVGVLGNPLAWLAFLALLAALVLLPIALGSGRFDRAFLASATAIVAEIGLVGVGLFPRLVPALGDLDASLTIANSSSSGRTLTTMLVIALVGMPLVIGYTVFIYRVFKGKVEAEEGGY